MYILGIRPLKVGAVGCRQYHAGSYTRKDVCEMPNLARGSRLTFQLSSYLTSVPGRVIALACTLPL